MKKMQKMFYKILSLLITSILLIGTAAVSAVPVSAVSNAADAALHQSGNQLLNAKGQAVRLLGVNVPQLAWSATGDGSTSYPDAEMVLDYALDDWQCNVIRLAVNPRFWLYGSFRLDSAGNLVLDSQGNPIQLVTPQQYRALVNRLVLKATNQGKYVLFDNHAFYLPGPDSVDFWLSAAPVYKNNPYVIYGLFNEPAGCTWEQWYSGGTITYNGLTDWGEPANVTITSAGMQSLVNTVRSTGATNVITVSGLDWGYDLSLVTTTYRLNDPAGNLMYETHPYPGRDPDWDTGFGLAAAEYPIIIGECGPLQQGNTAADEAYMEKLVTYMDKYELNLTAWALGAWPHLLDMTVWPTPVPSAYGTVIRDYIIQNNTNLAVTLTSSTGSASLNTGKYTASALNEIGVDIAKLRSFTAKQGSIYEYTLTFRENADGSGKKAVFKNSETALQVKIGFTPAFLSITRAPKALLRTDSLLENHLSSARGIMFNSSTGQVTASTRFTAADANGLSKAADGNLTTAFEVWGVLDWGNPARYIGAEFTLDNTYEASVFTVTAGGAYAETYRVYASDNINTLYTPANMIADGLVCKGATVEVALDADKPVKYIAFMSTGYTNSMTVKEYQALKVLEPLPDTGNVFDEHISSSRGILFNSATGQATANNRFTAADANALNKAVDGNTDTAFEVWGVLDWGNPARYVGAEFTLDGDYEVYGFNVFAGRTGGADTYRIYASDSLSTLYSPANMVADNLVCDGTKRTVTLDNPKTVRYVAYVCTNYLYSMFVAEYELIGVVPAAEPVVNLTQSKLSSAKGILFNSSTNTAVETTRFAAADANALSKAVDGNITASFEVWGVLDWGNPARYVGALITLDDTYTLTGFGVHAGTSAEADTYRIYASDSLSTLYNTGNIVADGIRCTGAEQYISGVSKSAKYVAFVCTGYTNSMHVSEYEVYGTAVSIG